MARDRKPLFVLALLALQMDRSMHRDDMARLLWPGLPAARQRASVRQALHSLRSWSSGCLRSEGAALTLAPGLSCDVWQLEEALEQRQDAQVLHLYRGHLLGDAVRRLEGEAAHSVEAEAARIRQRVVGALARRITALGTEGRLQEAAPLVERLIELEPLDDRAQMIAVQTLHAMGRSDEAIAVFEMYRTLLAGELGDSPSSALTDLVEDLRARPAPPPPPGSFPSVGPGTRPAALMVAAASVTLLLSLGWLSARTALRTEAAEPPAWTRGTIVLGGAEGTETGRLGPDGQWRGTGAMAASGFATPTLPLAGDGDSGAIGVRNDPEGSPDVVVRSGEEWELLWDGGGDDAPATLSPDGRMLLIATQDTSATDYRLDLLRLDLDSGDAEVIFKRPYVPTDVDWSPDGDRVITSAAFSSGPDSLYLLRPDGTVDAVWPSVGADIRLNRFCGPDHLVLLRQPLGELPHLVLFSLEEGSGRELSTVGSVHQASCSPDGTHLVVGEWLTSSTRVRTIRLDGEVEVATREFPGIRAVRWLPGFRPLPASVHAGSEAESVRWGARTTLRAEVLDGDGQPWSGPVEWVSLDPDIVQLRDSNAIGNAPGIARIVARAAGWVPDTLRLRVTDVGGPETWMARPLNQFDTTGIWQLLGDPVPHLVQREDSTFLRLAGDASYADGMISRSQFPWSQGLTLSIDFRMELTRSDKQSILLCLVEGAPPGPSELRWYPAWSVSSQSCVRYPNHELVRFRDNRVLLQGAGAPIELETARLPTSEWTKLGLRLRPDGSLEALVDGEIQGRHPLPVELRPDAELRIAVFGRDVDTELLVRNLVLWRGEGS